MVGVSIVFPERPALPTISIIEFASRDRRTPLVFGSEDYVLRVKLILACLVRSRLPGTGLDCPRIANELQDRAEIAQDRAQDEAR